MKILIVTQYFWPENFKITDLAKGLSDRGHEITVLTGKPNYPIGKLYPGYRVLGVQKERHGDISIIRTPLIPRGRSKVSLALNYVSFALTATLLAGFKSFKPEIIFVYGPSPVTACLPAIFLKKQNKVPLLFWVQDLWPESVVAVNALKNRLMLRLLHKLVYFIYKHCDQILSSSLAYFSSIKKFDIADEKLKYFPQTADKSYRPIEPHVCDEEDRLLPKGFRILFSGNLGIAQDLPFILNAAERLKHETEIKWIFIGDGSKRVWLQNQILKRQLTKTVFWLGAYPSIKMPYFFRW
ncbi:MAG: glycosyltransferase family 4 protein [Legionella sp.]|nr:glycosyltransferase family 4 protein [Legionella sp.]